MLFRYCTILFKSDIITAFVFGFSIPALFIFLKDMFNVKFKDRMDVERLTSVPVLGEIAKNDTGDQFVVKANRQLPLSNYFGWFEIVCNLC